MNINETLRYNDYKRFRSLEYELLSQEELAKFLVLDYFDACTDRIMGVKNIKEEYLKSQEILINKYNKYKPLFFFLDKLFLKLPHIFFKKRKKILFQNSKYPSLILQSRKYYDVGLVTQGIQDRFFAIKNYMNYVSVNDLDQLIYDYLKNGNIKYLYELLTKVEEKLKIVNPDYIVLRDDALPISRAIVLVSRKLGITTFAIQQGIYDLHSPFINDLAADYILVWGNYMKDLFLSQKVRNPEDIYVLGNPLYDGLVKKNKIIGKNKNYSLCYLAQDLERYDENFLEIKLKTIKNLFEICKKLGLKFIYRPHPWEDREMIYKRLFGIEFTPKKEKLEETFDRADIFVSFSSTALVEASMRAKISLQLMNFPIKLDNFEELGVCNKSFQNIKDLENYLLKIINEPDLEKFRLNFNNDYIETRGNLCRRFLKIIKEIENKK